MLFLTQGGVGTLLPIFFDLLNRNRHGAPSQPTGLDSTFQSAVRRYVLDLARAHTVCMVSRLSTCEGSLIHPFSLGQDRRCVFRTWFCTA
jgi:hypothetical protein